MENRIFKDRSIIPVISLEKVAKAEELKQQIHRHITCSFAYYADVYSLYNSSYRDACHSRYRDETLSKTEKLCNIVGDFFSLSGAADDELTRLRDSFISRCDFINDQETKDVNIEDKTNITKIMQMYTQYNAYSTLVANLLPTIQYVFVSTEFPDVSVFDTPIMNTVEITSSEGRRIRLHKSHFNECVDFSNGVIFNTALYKISIEFKRESFLVNELFSMVAGGYVSLIIPNTAGTIGNSIVHIDITEN